MTNNFKNGIDRNFWVQTSPAPNAHAAGMGICCDLRNDLSRNPFAYQLASAAILNRYNFITKSWNYIGSSVALAGTFGAGTGCTFAPSHALTCAVGAGSTSSKVTMSTTITSVAANMFANRGGSGEYGFRVRVTGNAGGSSGKVEERWIVANTAGTSPTIWLDKQLSFVPIAGDTIEILGGKVFMLNAGTLASQSWKSYEVAANTLTTLTQTGLPATVGTDYCGIALDELYVPYDKKPGEGFLSGSVVYDSSGSGISKYCLVASASGSQTLTGTSVGGDIAILANEYRNFQIRVVEDTSIPTAVGQRRIIASHTSGSSGSVVYALGSSWTVTPSTTCKYVVENPNLLLLWTTNATTTYTYNYGPATINNGTNNITTGAWSTTYFAARGSAMAAGCTSFPSFGIEPDIGRNARHSFIYSFRGGGATALDVFDIAGAATGLWANAVVYDGTGMATLNIGACGKYAPYDQEGRFGYLNGYVASQFNQIYRFDVKNRVLTPYTPTDWIQAGTAAAGDRLVTCVAVDGTDKYTMILLVSHTSTVALECLVMV